MKKRVHSAMRVRRFRPQSSSPGHTVNESALATQLAASRLNGCIFVVCSDSFEREMLERYVRRSMPGTSVISFPDTSLVVPSALDVAIVRVRQWKDLSQVSMIADHARGVVVVVDDVSLGPEAYRLGAHIVKTAPVDFDLLASAAESLRRRARVDEYALAAQ